MEEEADADGDAGPEGPLVGGVAGDGEDGLLAVRALAEGGLVEDETLIAQGHVHGDDAGVLRAAIDLGDVAGVALGFFGAGVEFALEFFEADGEGQFPLLAGEGDGVGGVGGFEGVGFEGGLPEDGALLGTAVFGFQGDGEDGEVLLVGGLDGGGLDDEAVDVGDEVVGFEGDAGVALVAGDLEFEGEAGGVEGAGFAGGEVLKLVHGDDEGLRLAFAIEAELADLDDALVVALIDIAGLAFEEREGTLGFEVEGDKAGGQHEHDGEVGDEDTEGAPAFAHADDGAASHVDEEQDHEGHAAGEPNGDDGAAEVEVVDDGPGVEVLALAVEQTDVGLREGAEQGDDEQQAQDHHGEAIGGEEAEELREGVVGGHGGIAVRIPEGQAQKFTLNGAFREAADEGAGS